MQERELINELGLMLRDMMKRQQELCQQVEKVSQSSYDGRYDSENRLRAVEDRYEILRQQNTEINRILKQSAELEVERRLYELEKEVGEQKTPLSLLSGLPRPLQYLAIVSFSLAAASVFLSQLLK